MTSKQRILAAIDGRAVDHVPLATWCFGLAAPPQLQWQRAGQPVEFWYSLRMEHIHTLPQPWTLEDDFQRARAWLSMGLDDVLDVSVPWSRRHGVAWTDRIIPAGQQDPCPVLQRVYRTPAGALRHSIRQSAEAPPAGWVVQPPRAELFEDYNITRAVKHAVAGPADVEPVFHLYAAPERPARDAFFQRMAVVKAFADRVGVAVQAWSAFGMDAAVWLCGAEGAVTMARDHPEAFGRLIEIIAAADLARTDLAADNAGVDIIVQRGWYSSTGLWSPELFDRYVLPGIRGLADLAHRRGKRFAYVMTTGVQTLGPRLAQAGVDLLYFVDPVQGGPQTRYTAFGGPGGISPGRAHDLLGGHIALAGGVNALTLRQGPQAIGDQVRHAVGILKPTGRFILQPVDALFPDTPWEGVEALIEAWKECW